MVSVLNGFGLRVDYLSYGINGRSLGAPGYSAVCH